MKKNKNIFNYIINCLNKYFCLQIVEEEKGNGYSENEEENNRISSISGLCKNTF